MSRAAGSPPARRLLLTGFAVVAALGAAGALTLSGHDRSDAVADTPRSAATGGERESSMAWMVAGDGQVDGVLEATTEQVADRWAPVVRLRRTAAGSAGSGSILQNVDVTGRAGETLLLGADLKVEGTARAGMYLRVSGPEVADGSVAELAVRTTPAADEVRAGGWEHRAIELRVPEGAADVTFGVYLRGDGSVLVDAVEGP